jgi:hypothetical protein
MNRTAYVLKNLMYLVFILLLVFILVFAIRMQLETTNHNTQNTNLKPSQQACAPTPQLSIKEMGLNTPTPNPDEFGTIPKLAPSVTPLPISKMTDLATDLPDKDKVYVYIMRCSGDFELFLLNPNVKITEAIPLQPGDVILDWIPPASLMGHRPPIITSQPSPTNLPDGTPYPLPGTQVPYP